MVIIECEDIVAYFTHLLDEQQIEYHTSKLPNSDIKQVGVDVRLDCHNEAQATETFTLRVEFMFLKDRNGIYKDDAFMDCCVATTCTPDLLAAAQAYNAEGPGNLYTVTNEQGMSLRFKMHTFIFWDVPFEEIRERLQQYCQVLHLLSSTFPIPSTPGVRMDTPLHWEI